ncbi:MAG: hypothetical protein IT236_05865 [Bacteroidia bacterium]|nr:hypothetical protein [Bacteroidia bacterium]
MKNETEQMVNEMIEALKSSIKYTENVIKQLSSMPTNSSLIYELYGKNDGLKLAIINILQIAKEHKVKTKYDEQINEQLSTKT